MAARFSRTTVITDSYVSLLSSAATSTAASSTTGAATGSATTSSVLVDLRDLVVDDIRYILIIPLY